MSAQPQARERPGEHVAGYLAAAAIVVALVGIVEKPLRTTTVAILVALLALALSGERQHTLVALAVGVATVSFVLGMTVSIATGRDLW